MRPAETHALYAVFLLYLQHSPANNYPIFSIRLNEYSPVKHAARRMEKSILRLALSKQYAMQCDAMSQLHAIDQLSPKVVMARTIYNHPSPLYKRVRSIEHRPYHTTSSHHQPRCSTDPGSPRPCASRASSSTNVSSSVFHYASLRRTGPRTSEIVCPLKPIAKCWTHWQSRSGSQLQRPRTKRSGRATHSSLRLRMIPLPSNCLQTHRLVSPPSI